MRRSDLQEKCDVVKLEQSVFKTALERCAELIRSYREFDAVNDERTGTMEQFFAEKWTGSMKVWYGWSAESVLCWIKLGLYYIFYHQ